MIYFDNGSTSFPKAPGVAQAVGAVLTHGCFNINRGAYARAYEAANVVFEAREKLATLFGCSSGREVVFTGGLTQSINMVLKGLLKPGDHVVTTQMEHNAVMRPLAQMEEQGVRVDVARCDEDGLLDFGDMASKITNRTRLVVMTHASNVCGSILPIREVGAICRERGALLLVDAAQTGGVLPISVRRDGIDILAFSGHKGLLGPMGIGGLLLAQGIAEQMTPLIAGGTGSHSDVFKMPTELPDHLEAGTLNLPGIAGLSAALDCLNQIGIDAIYMKEMKLLTRLADGLRARHDVRMLGPKRPSDKCAILALDFLNRDNADIARRLDEDYRIMTRCGLHCAPAAHRALGTFPRGVVRCSFGYENTESEVDRLLEAVEEILDKHQ